MQGRGVPGVAGLSFLALSLIVLLLIGAACTQAPGAGPTPIPQPTAVSVLPTSTTETPPSLTPSPSTNPTQVVRPLRPVTWTVRTITDTTTGMLVGVVDDPRVYQMVEDDYLEGERWFFAQAFTLTQASTPTQLLEEYFTGQRLLGMEGLVNRFRDEGRAFRSQLTDRRIEVKNFSADGRQVYLGDSWSSSRLSWYSFSTGEVVEEQEQPGGMVIITMLYDPERGRWRSAAVRPVDTEKAP